MIREIPLTKGYVAIIDAADWPLVSTHKWHAQIVPLGNGHVYAVSSRSKQNGGRVLLMHRLIAGAQGKEKVDHWDNDGLNNRRANLRRCTHSQNLANAGLRRNNTTGFKGVEPEGSRFRARINDGGKRRRLGRFATAEMAARAYDAAAIRVFGEFSCLNFPVVAKKEAA